MLKNDENQCELSVRQASHNSPSTLEEDQHSDGGCAVVRVSRTAQISDVDVVVVARLQRPLPELSLVVEPEVE